MSPCGVGTAGRSKQSRRRKKGSRRLAAVNGAGEREQRLICYGRGWLSSRGGSIHEERVQEEGNRRKRMRKNWSTWLGAATVAGLLVCANGVAAAQGSQNGQGSQSKPPAQQSDKPKTPEATPLTLDAPAPVNAEEDTAYKAFQAVNPSDAAKKIETGEAFLQKYPESRYKSPVYGALTYAYLQAGNTQKMQAYGEKETALRPNGASTPWLLGATLPP